jgi:hypothetical protein
LLGEFPQHIRLSGSGGSGEDDRVRRVSAAERRGDGAEWDRNDIAP